jgi:ubiquinone/menaquinone biosynthesis C-methylase UbiE
MVENAELPAFQRQQDYYRAMADQYDSPESDDQIEYAMYVLDGYLKRTKIASLLEVGSGTGRALLQIQKSFPEISVVGIEPSDALRDAAYRKGVPQHKLLHGDGYNLQFAENAFDLVTEFAVLHHVRDPRRVVTEMVRVAKEGVFLCDSNNWGQGSFVSRSVKSLLRWCKLWPVYIFLSTRGRSYKYSEGDGIFYSFSLFDVLDIVKEKFPYIYIMNSKTPGKVIRNFLFEAPGFCVLAVK